jgi:hypothetical protein
MELVSYDDETVTIKMKRKEEFARLLAVLQTVGVEFERLDKELLMLSKDEADRLVDAVFALSSKLPAAKLREY